VLTVYIFSSGIKTKRSWSVFFSHCTRSRHMAAISWNPPVTFCPHISRILVELD
jgi:hypothetical protein